MSEPKIKKTEAEWRQQLTPEQYYVLREHGTERAGTSPLDGEKRTGTFKCAGCGRELFSSEAKFDSGTGWPSYWAPIAEDRVRFEEDRSFFMRRTEVRCAVCDAHLGHVFTGEGFNTPTDKRYCINGTILKFVPAKSGQNGDRKQP